MIKRYGINKFIVSTFILFLICLISIMPDNKLNVNIEVEGKKEANQVIYLLDENDYVSKLNIYIGKTEIEDIIKEKILLLRDGNEDFMCFKTLIPKDTIINSINVKEDKVYLDFSKEFLNVEKNLVEPMIEAIVYSITEINGINDIYINIDNKELTGFPNSDYKVVLPLRRTIGINKEYDIKNLNNITKTTIFFIKENEDTKYYVPVTKVSNDTTEKINIIINELKSSVYSIDNLNSYLRDEAILDSYNKTEDTFNLIFNSYIYESIGSKTILEEVKYTIAESIFENYDVKEVTFSTKEDKNIDNYIEK